MADFSLTTLFVVPVGNTLPSSGSTQDLTAGQFGFFRSNYSVANAGNIAALPYWYADQGRVNTFMLGSKRSDKISGPLNVTSNLQGSNVTSYRKVVGCPTAANQITNVSSFTAKCGDVITITLRAHSSYIDTLYFNGFTRSITLQAPCCDCGSDPCDVADAQALVDQAIAKFAQSAPGINSDNIGFSTFFTFSRTGTGSSSVLKIEGKPLTVYGQPCDIAADPQEYDRMWFSTFVYSGPATTADFIVADNCDIVATATVAQEAGYATGTSVEIAQLEKNYYSYQAGYLKSLYRMAGFNENFESWVTPGTVYDTFYITFNQYEKAAYQWGDYVPEDSTVIIAVPQALTSGIEAVLAASLGAVTADNTCVTTTTIAPTTTTTTT